MDSQIIILQGGEDVKRRTNESLIRRVGELSRSKKIMIIPWTSDSGEKEAEYRAILHGYFSSNGFQEVRFLEREDTERVTVRKFDSVDVVYLPGGDPRALYEELEKRSLQDRLREFRGIIVGNSAGAIVLSRGAKEGETFYPGFGLVDFFISVHYSLHEEPISGTDGKIIVNIPENMWIAVAGKR